MILIGLNACLNCGSFCVRNSLLCHFCVRRMLEADICAIERSSEKSMCVYSLFDWVPEQSDVLSKLLIKLKGPKRKSAWASWAKIFWLERVHLLTEAKKLVFIPSASSGGVPDHAFYFAEALAEQSGGEFVNILRKVTKSHQKDKRRDERADVIIQSHVKIAADCANTLYVLVDDVLTTGSTALSSYQALGRPVNFEVWVLAKRSLSCGVSLDLI